MACFTVQNGKRYQATINLGLVQRLASNDIVADKFREAGFTDVTITPTHAVAEGMHSAIVKASKPASAKSSRRSVQFPHTCRISGPSIWAVISWWMGRGYSL